MSEAIDIDKIRDKVCLLVAEVLALEPSGISPEARVFGDLGAESIDLLDLRFRAERVFGVRISAPDLLQAISGDDPDSFRERFTVGALCAYLQRLLEPPRG